MWAYAIRKYTISSDISISSLTLCLQKITDSFAVVCVLSIPYRYIPYIRAPLQFHLKQQRFSSHSDKRLALLILHIFKDGTIEMWYIDTTDTLSTVLQLSLRGITSLINICMLQPTKAVKPTPPVLVRMGNLLLGSFFPVTLPSLDPLSVPGALCVCIVLFLKITLHPQTPKPLKLNWSNIKRNSHYFKKVIIFLSILPSIRGNKFRI